MRATAIATVAIVITLGVLFAYFQPRIGDVFETRVDSSPTLDARIEAREELCEAWCLPGAYYVFLSSPRGTDRWRTITTFRHDDPVRPPRSQRHESEVH